METEKSLHELREALRDAIHSTLNLELTPQQLRYSVYTGKLLAALTTFLYNNPVHLPYPNALRKSWEAEQNIKYCFNRLVKYGIDENLLFSIDDTYGNEDFHKKSILESLISVTEYCLASRGGVKKSVGGLLDKGIPVRYQNRSTTIRANPQEQCLEWGSGPLLQRILLNEVCYLIEGTVLTAEEKCFSVGTSEGFHVFEAQSRNFMLKAVHEIKQRTLQQMTQKSANNESNNESAETSRQIRELEEALVKTQEKMEQLQGRAETQQRVISALTSENQELHRRLSSVALGMWHPEVRPTVSPACACTPKSNLTVVAPKPQEGLVLEMLEKIIRGQTDSYRELVIDYSKSNMSRHRLYTFLSRVLRYWKTDAIKKGIYFERLQKFEDIVCSQKRQTLMAIGEYNSALKKLHFVVTSLHSDPIQRALKAPEETNVTKTRSKDILCKDISESAFLELRSKLNEGKGSGEDLTRLCELLMSVGSFEEVLATWRRSCRGSLRTSLYESSLLKGYVWEAERLVRDPGEAVVLLRAKRNEMEKSGNMFGAAKVLLNTGTVLCSLRAYDEAWNCYEVSRLLFCKLKAAQSLRGAMMAFGNLYKAVGDASSAMAAYASAQTLQEGQIEY